MRSERAGSITIAGNISDAVAAGNNPSGWCTADVPCAQAAC
jgi:hypothetical protein